MTPQELDQAKVTETTQSTSGLSEGDKAALEIASLRTKLAVAQAEKFLALKDNAELGYKYLVMQIFQKYNLTPQDSIDEQGNFHYGKKE